MFNWIKELAKKWNLFKKNFSKATFFQKFIIILVIAIQFDIAFFVLRNSIGYSNYMQELKVWEKQIQLLEEKNNNIKDKKILKDNQILIDKQKEFEKTGRNIQKILKEPDLYNNISKIYIMPTNENLFNIKIIFNNLKDYSININQNSFIANVEPKLIDNNISYSWTTFKDISNKEEETLLKPIYEVKSFIILPFIAREIFTILLILLLLYTLEKSGSLSGGNNKFEILLPENIKGSMDDLIGMEEIKEDITQLKDLIYNRDKYKDFGIEKTFNIMFSGPPGTGKTKIASYLSKSLGIPMIIGTGNVETGFVAGGANTLKELFKTARLIAEQNVQKTCLIFLDEAQVLLRKRGQSRDKWSDDSANELLAQLDGVNTKDGVDIIFIAASNFDDANMEIDEAMERRFKKKIFFRLPNREERENIFKFYMDKIKEEFKEKNIDYKYISEISSRLSPAKIETIVQKAGMLAIKNNQVVSTELLVKSFENVLIGDTTRKTTEKQEDVRKIVIFHELGHFIADYDNQVQKYGENVEKIKENIRLLKISSESISKYNALGYVLNTEEEVGLKTKKDLENEIISLYGGLAAEVHFLNNDNSDTSNVTTGSYNDIEKVSRILKHMVKDLGMYSNTKVNLSILELKNEEETIKIIKNVSERLFEETLEKIKKHEELINFIYPVLMDKWVLNKNELFDLIFEFEEYKKGPKLIEYKKES